MSGLRRFIAASMLVATGCSPSPSDTGPFGASQQSPLLTPFAGQWGLESEKTFAAMKAGGMSDEAVEQLRKLYVDTPVLGGLHPDISITGNVAVGTSGLSSEYRFFALHQHDDTVCGKAWHHEDRFDPGDMSKCYVRLKLKDNDLYLEVRMQDGNPDLDDPDLQPSLPVEGGSAEKCDADRPPGTDWSEWNTYVFSRKS